MEISTNITEVTLYSPVISGYAYVHIVQQITTSESILVQSVVTESISKYELLTDGYYIITEIKLPDSPTVGEYYTDGEYIYDDSGNVITPEELLDVDTNIIREDNNYFSYYFTEKYYIDLIKSKFLSGICSCNCGASIYDKVTVDTLTMGIDVIKILLKYDQYLEAQRIIEGLSVCTGNVNSNCNCYD